MPLNKIKTSEPNIGINRILYTKQKNYEVVIV